MSSTETDQKLKLISPVKPGRRNAIIKPNEVEVISVIEFKRNLQRTVNSIVTPCQGKINKESDTVGLAE
jgi:hypothetical protein